MIIDELGYGERAGDKIMTGHLLSSLLDQVLAYVEDVLAEKTEPNNAAGRQLLELLNSVPNLSADTFADAFASSVKDLLMVVTLAQLIKTQLQLNEKLTLLTSQ
ncbi:unnamed protein product [Arctia plantaginis]|uniref:EIF3F/CSN6-like C-terminal domain-containing protein n=1 Tax=Arctia plantaginis TaxID=874455 RepID=A0A8S1B9K1_ARCPL|nr:unnamed protein product [Arctia plantaginis]